MTETTDPLRVLARETRIAEIRARLEGWRANCAEEGGDSDQVAIFETHAADDIAWLLANAPQGCYDTNSITVVLDEFFPACTNVHCSWPAHRCIPNDDRDKAKRFLEAALRLAQQGTREQMVKALEGLHADWCHRKAGVSTTCTCDISIDEAIATLRSQEIPK